VDFSWTDDQQTLRDAVVRFAKNELNRDTRARDRNATFDRDVWKRCAEIGIQGLAIPAEYGGSGSDASTIAYVMEGLGEACADNGLLFSLGAQMWSAEVPLVRYGTPEQKARWLPGLADGSVIGVQAMTETETGSDAMALSTTATRDDDGYVLRGSKIFITNAPVADMFVAFATIDRSKGWAGVSAFVVDRRLPGIELGVPQDKMGLRTSPMSEVHFVDCRVPHDAVLGKPGGGLAIFNHSMDWERSLILATAVGSMQRQLDQCVAYARERRQFGKPIGKFQAVSHRIVNMKLRLKGARLALYHLAWLKSQGKATPSESAEVKLAISEAYVESSLDAISVHGGYGYMTELELERELRDAVASRIYSGTSDVLRNVVASRMGL
jgi:alkylation response protein AidB-like acyl-CoA dehydrogenase